MATFECNGRVVRHLFEVIAGFPSPKKPQRGWGKKCGFDLGTTQALRVVVATDPEGYTVFSGTASGEEASYDLNASPLVSQIALCDLPANILSVLKPVRAAKDDDVVLFEQKGDEVTCRIVPKTTQA